MPQAAEALANRGFKAVSLTLSLRFPSTARTFSQRREIMGAALESFQKRRAWGRWVEDYMLSLDVTLRPRKAPHIHVHAILFLPADADLARAESALLASWRAAVHGAGGRASAGGQRWHPVTTQEGLERAVYYVTQAPADVGHRYSGSIKAMILAADTDPAAAMALRDLAQGVKRFRQLRLSRGFHLAVQEPDEDEDMPEAEPGTDDFAAVADMRPTEPEIGPVAWVPRESVSVLQAQGRWGGIRRAWRAAPLDDLHQTMLAALAGVPGARVRVPGTLRWMPTS